MPTTTSSTDGDLSYRPASYFWPLGLETHLLSRVKGARRKAALKELIDGGRAEDVPEFLAKSALSEEERAAIGRIHPMFMGGEYLPDIDGQEVEIARVCIKSTTYDVTSVYARRTKRRIYFRIVDEYDGETLTGRTTRTSVKPLTLKELLDFLDGAWPAANLLRWNDFRDVEEALDFFSAQSQFYPQIGAVYAERVERAYLELNSGAPQQQLER
jgi:hypothetical protein